MGFTHLGALRTDHRVTEAKRLLLDAVKDQQKEITGIRPPNPEQELHYRQALEEIERFRGSKLWYPYLGSGIGKGALVELMDGSVKYDFIGGIGVHHFGHSHPRLIEASIDAAITDIVMQGNLQFNTDTVELLEILVKESKMPHCFLTTSGSMANENALKVAFQKNFPAKRILAFERGFCGRSLAMTQITEKPDLREGLPTPLNVDFIPFFDPKEPEKSTKAAVDTLKRYLWRYPKDYAVMIFELIQGEGGYYPGNTEFFRTLMNILKEHHIAVFVDEVQTFGRTSRLFAYQHYGLEDLVDIVTLGKMSQVCATLYTQEYNPKPGLLSQTFTGSTSGIHVAKLMIHMMIKEGFFGPNGKNMEVHRQFTKKFDDIGKRSPNRIQGPYGLGAMIAFTPLNGQMDTVKDFTHRLYHAGVIAFVCGRDPTRVRFLAPIGAIESKDIDAVMEIVEETLCT